MLRSKFCSPPIYAPLCHAPLSAMPLHPLCSLPPHFDGKHFRSSSHNLMQIPHPRSYRSDPGLVLPHQISILIEGNIFIFPSSFCAQFLCISMASLLVLGLTFALAAHALHPAASFELQPRLGRGTEERVIPSVWQLNQKCSLYRVYLALYYAYA